MQYSARGGGAPPPPGERQCHKRSKYVVLSFRARVLALAAEEEEGLADDGAFFAPQEGHLKHPSAAPPRHARAPLPLSRKKGHKDSQMIVRVCTRK